MNRPLFPEVIVNGEVIPQASIASEAQNHEAPKGKPGVAWRKAAKALVIRKLLLQEAHNRNLAPEPTDLGNKRFETEEEALIRGLLDDELVVDSPSEEAVVAVWNRDPTKFRTPPLWEASHVLCAADPSDEEATKKALLRAKALAKTACDDPKNFHRIAASESDCSSKSDGGALGQLNPGDTVPEFEAALKELSEGQITTEPVRTRFGFHIIRLDARAEGKVLPFEVVRPRIEEAMEKSAWAKSAQNFTQRLVASADLKGVEL
jgi:peptidyl-prolyl cis-trans isomerase C